MRKIFFIFLVRLSCGMSFYLFTMLFATNEGKKCSRNAVYPET